MKKILLTLFALAIAYGAQAQNSLGINLKAYSPKAQFNRNVDNVPVGLSFTYLRSYNDSRFSWGGEFGVAMYSNDSYDIEWRGAPLRIEEEDCFFTLHAFVRYDLVETQSFRLYSEGRVGVTTFFSTTMAEDEYSDFEGEFDFHGTAFNLGAGAGVMVNPKALFSKDKERGNLWIDLAVNAHSGSNARYRMMPEGDGMHTFEDGQFESLTHYIGYRVGFVFGL